MNALKFFSKESLLKNLLRRELSELTRTQAKRLVICTENSNFLLENTCKAGGDVVTDFIKVFVMPGALFAMIVL